MYKVCSIFLVWLRVCRIVWTYLQYRIAYSQLIRLRAVSCILAPMPLVVAGVPEETRSIIFGADFHRIFGNRHYSWIQAVDKLPYEDDDAAFISSLPNLPGSLYKINYLKGN